MRKAIGWLANDHVKAGIILTLLAIYLVHDMANYAVLGSWFKFSVIGLILVDSQYAYWSRWRHKLNGK